jgi:hypothetical protein
MKRRNFLFTTLVVVVIHFKASAWRAEGHAIIGRLAMRFVKEDVRQEGPLV